MWYNPNLMECFLLKEKYNLILNSILLLYVELKGQVVRFR